MDKILDLLLTGEKKSIALGLQLTKSQSITQKILAYFKTSFDFCVKVGAIEYDRLNLEAIQAILLLKELICSNQQLDAVVLKGLVSLEYLDCSKNQLVNLEVQGLSNLRYLHCNHNKLSSLDVTNLIKLEVLNCYHNELRVLKLGRLKNLDTLHCYQNSLAHLNLKDVGELKYLDCSDNATLNSVEVSKEYYEKLKLYYSSPASELFIQNIGIKDFKIYKNSEIN